MDGGAWPFLVGGVICLVNSDNERGSHLLNSRLDLVMRGACRPVAWPVACCASAWARCLLCVRRRFGVNVPAAGYRSVGLARCPLARYRAPSKSVAYSNVFLEGFTALKPYETESNNRSVMPLDVLGCTRVTMPVSTGYYTFRGLL